MNQILLKCTKCKRQKMTERLDVDYPEAVMVQIICPECDTGDFSEVFYYDKNGKHIIRDPNIEL